MSDYKLGLSNGSYFWTSVENSMDMFSNAGFDCIDYRMFERGISESTRFNDRIKKHKSYADSVGLSIYQAHGPYISLFGNENDEKLLKKDQITAINGSESIGVSCLVFHPCIFGWCVEDKGRDEALERNFEWFSEYIPLLNGLNVTVCIENCYIDDLTDIRTRETCLSTAPELIKLTDELNRLSEKKNFGVCVDTGHCFCSGGKPEKMISLLGERVKALHLHENDGRDDYHLVPFTLKKSIDWVATLQALKTVKYKGVLNFEIDSTQIPKLSKKLADDSIALIYETGRYFNTLM